MIYTCTLNPAIDYYIHSDLFTIGELNRSQNSSMSIGGKGINVSVMLKNLGVDSILTGFLGGFTGQYIEEYLNNELHLTTRFIRIHDLTRINIKLSSSGVETEINQSGPHVNQDAQEKLISFLSEMNEKDIFVCGGTKPLGMNNIFKEIASVCQQKNISFVMDTSKQDLLDVLPHNPLLVKPNIHELEEIYGVKINSLDDIIYYGTDLLNRGANMVIVSRGKHGSIFISRNHVYISPTIDGQVKSTIGAGDSMVAGFIAEYSRSEDEFESYKLAIASGSATAFSDSLASEKDVLYLLNKVIIEEVIPDENH